MELKKHRTTKVLTSEGSVTVSSITGEYKGEQVYVSGKGFLKSVDVALYCREYGVDRLPQEVELLRVSAYYSNRGDEGPDYYWVMKTSTVPVTYRSLKENFERIENYFDAEQLQAGGGLILTGRDDKFNYTDVNGRTKWTRSMAVHMDYWHLCGYVPVSVSKDGTRYTVFMSAA